MNLYEINAALMQAYDDAVDQETGEIIENEAYKAIDDLQMALEEKTENVLLWIKNLQRRNWHSQTGRREQRQRSRVSRSMSVKSLTGRSSRQRVYQHHGENQKRLSMLAMCLHCRKIISSILIQLWTRQH